MAKTKEQQGYTVTEQDLLNDGTAVTTPAAPGTPGADYSQYAPEVLPEQSFTKETPQLRTYDRAKQLYSSWTPEVLPKQEIEKRTRRSAQVESLSRLGQAISAFQNMRGAMKGAAAQKPAEPQGTAPLKEWLKEQDAKRLEAAKTTAEARQADYAEWKTDYQTWLAEKKANDLYNEKIRLANAKAHNDYNKALMKKDIDAAAAAQKAKDAKDLKTTIPGKAPSTSTGTHSTRSGLTREQKLDEANRLIASGDLRGVSDRSTPEEKIRAYEDYASKQRISNQGSGSGNHKNDPFA